jgi:hypothetical protein
VIGRAPFTGRTGVTRAVGSAVSMTVPHCWHSPQRPTHFEAVHPHSVQTNAGGAGRVFAMVSG